MSEAPPDEIEIVASYEAYKMDVQTKNRPWIPMELWREIVKDPELVRQWNNFDWNKAPGNKGKGHSLNMHDLQQQPLPDSTDDEPELPIVKTDANNNPIMAHMTQTKPIASSEIRDIIAQAHKTNKTPQQPPKQRINPTKVNVIDVDGKRYMQISMHRLGYMFGKTPDSEVHYKVTVGEQIRRIIASLMDRGANGGFAGADCILLEQSFPLRYADVTGAGNKQINHLPLGTYAGKVMSHKGPVILIMHQYAGFHKGKSIHSAGQWEHRGHQVDDKSRTVGGKQRIITTDGYAIPLQIRDGLPCLDMSPPTPEELESLPHVIATHDHEWDPKCLDCEQDITTMEDLPADNYFGIGYLFDAQGNYRRREVCSLDIGDGDTVHMEFDHFVDYCTKAVRLPPSHGPVLPPSF